MNRFVRLCANLTLAAWWGGLTVYAGIVVPIGTELIGSIEQGFVTQRVTNWLNILATLVLCLSAWNVFASHRRWLMATWTVIAISLVALIVLHATLDRMLDSTQHSISDSDHFYFIHRLYLWLTAVQWLAGIGLLWGLQVPTVSGGSTIPIK